MWWHTEYLLVRVQQMSDAEIAVEYEYQRRMERQRPKLRRRQPKGRPPDPPIPLHSLSRVGVQ